MTYDANCYLFCYTSSQKGRGVLYCVFDRFETSKQTHVMNLACAE